MAVDIKHIVDMLAAKAHELAIALFPAGVKDGGEYCVGNLRGDPGQSLRIHIAGSKSGVWADFSMHSFGRRDGYAGDALDLIAQALFGGDKSQAVAWARVWLGLDSGDLQRFRTVTRAGEEHRKKAKAGDDASRNRERAFKLWLGARENLRGTQSAQYLLERGLDLSLLGRQPRSLRHVDALEYWHKTDPRKDAALLGTFPALLATIVNGAGDTVAVHRTWHTRLANGRVVKAPVPDPKRTLGRYVGGAIRLWRGVGPDGKPGRRLAEIVDVGDVDPLHADNSVTLTEGIEDGLSIAIADPERRVMVAVALANMASLELPPAIRTVTIAKQNDAPGSPAEKSLGRVIETFLAQGRDVLIAEPPAGIKDPNDLLRLPSADRAAIGGAA